MRSSPHSGASCTIMPTMKLRYAAQAVRVCVFACLCDWFRGWVGRCVAAFFFLPKWWWWKGICVYVLLLRTPEAGDGGGDFDEARGRLAQGAGRHLDHTVCVWK